MRFHGKLRIHYYLIDLNHYNDDSKKEMFFPSEDLHINTTYQDPATFEPTTFQQHDPHPAHQENQQLLETAKEIIDVGKKELESVTVSPPPSSQSCVRNLCSDLGINRRKKSSLPKRAPHSNINTQEQSLDKAAPIKSTSKKIGAGGQVLFESQQSYHKNQDDIAEPKCLNLKTPTKLTYINEDHVISSQSQAQLPPLQDIGRCFVYYGNSKSDFHIF